MAQVAHTIELAAAPARAARPRLLTLAIVLAVGLLGVAMAWPAVQGRIFVADDLGAFHLPARTFYADALARGDGFDWWPQLFNGFYLTGEGQLGSYHPLHLVLYRFLPLGLAFNLEVLLSYPWMFAGAYLWLRRRVHRSDAAAAGAMLLTFCGFNLLHLPHVNAVAVVAHIPWLLWAIDVIVSDGRPRLRLLAALMFPLLTASQLLLGYPQYVWYSLLLEFGYTCWMLHRQRVKRIESGNAFFNFGANRRRRMAPPLRPAKVWLTLAAGLVVGGLLGAIQLLPTLDALLTSVRHDSGRAFADFGSLHPLNLMQLVAPYLFENRVVGLNVHELGLYAGCVPLVLCVWLWIRRAELGSLRPLVLAAAWGAFLSLWLATGQFGSLYHLQTLLPVVGKFRFPCRAIVLFEISVAVLSAAAIALLASPQPARTRLAPNRYVPLWAVVWLSVLVPLVAVVLWPENIARWSLALTGPALIATAAWLVWMADGNRRPALAALVLLAALDLGAYGLSYSLLGKTSELAEFSASTNPPPAGDNRRLLAQLPSRDGRTPEVGNRALLSGWSRVGGYAGLEPARMLNYSQLPALQVAGVGWVRRTPETCRIAGLIPHNDELLQVPDVQPPQRLVTQVQASLEPARDLNKINFAMTALVEPGFARQVALTPGPAGSVKRLDAGPGRLSLETHCDGPQLLVLDQSWHRGWQATVDGRPVSTWRVNGDFLGCVVPRGTAHVNVDFHPRSLQVGERITCAGLGLWLIGLVWGLRAPRTRTKEQNT